MCSPQRIVILPTRRKQYAPRAFFCNRSLHQLRRQEIAQKYPEQSAVSAKQVELHGGLGSDALPCVGIAASMWIFNRRYQAITRDSQLSHMRIAVHIDVEQIIAVYC
jgi:hypothetical protein